MNLSPKDMEAAREAASIWLARRDAGFDANSEKEFTSWLRASDAHRVAWEEAERVWNAFTPAVSVGAAAGMIKELSRRRRNRHRRNGAIVGACCAAMAVCAVLWRQAPIADAVVPSEKIVVANRATVSRPERRVLEDGTVIELNAGARVTVEYTTALRMIYLLAGEVHFSVVHNEARPFQVIAGSVVVRDVGTRFSMRLKPQAAEILVTEGEVGVHNENIEAPQVLVSAGNRVSVPLQAIGSALVPERASPEETRAWLAWRGPRLVLASTTVADAVEALNHENSTQIEVADAALAQMRLSGVFRADNAEGFVRLLETSYGIRVERVGDRVRLRSDTP